MKNTVPLSWHLTTLGNIAKWGSGGTPSRKEPRNYNGSIPWIKTGDLGPKVITKTSESITDLGVKHSSAKFFPKGSVAIAMYGATIGKTSILGIEATTNQACAVGDPIKDLSDSNFLYYFLKNEKDSFISKGKGGAQPNISQAIIKEHTIALPPLAEQKVIAEKLDTLLAQVDATKTRLERIPNTLKRFRQSVLAAAVSGKLTDEWRSKSEDSLDISTYKSLLGSFKTKAKGLSTIFENNRWLSCQLGHIISVKSGDGLTAKQMISDGEIPVYGGNGITGYHNEYNIIEQSIVIGRVGFYCGSVHLTKERAWVTDNALIVNFPKNLLSKNFLYILLNATNLREDTSSSAQPVISGTKIYPISVSIPPIGEQSEIVRQVEQLFAYADKLEQKAQAALSRVNQLTQSILAKAFRGELTADWRAANPELISGDNSAAALLSRIQEANKSSKATSKSQVNRSN